MALPRDRKPDEQLRRRNRPEAWTVLPAAGCKLPVPRWPIGKASRAEAALWRRLWRSPLAAFWHEQATEPTIVARYARLSIERPEHATVGQLERELGLTPASMQRLRLVIEQPEPETVATADPYADLKVRLGGKS